MQVLVKYVCRFNYVSLLCFLVYIILSSLSLFYRQEKVKPEALEKNNLFQNIVSNGGNVSASYAEVMTKLRTSMNSVTQILKAFSKSLQQPAAQSTSSASAGRAAAAGVVGKQAPASRAAASSSGQVLPSSISKSRASQSLASSSVLSASSDSQSAGSLVALDASGARSTEGVLLLQEVSSQGGTPLIDDGMLFRTSSIVSGGSPTATAPASYDLSAYKTDLKLEVRLNDRDVSIESSVYQWPNPTVQHYKWTTTKGMVERKLQPVVEMGNNIKARFYNCKNKELPSVLDQERSVDTDGDQEQLEFGLLMLDNCADLSHSEVYREPL